MGEVGGVRPGFEVGGGVDSDDKVLGVCYDHDPMVLIPDNFGISKLLGADADHWIIGVIYESVSTV